MRGVSPIDDKRSKGSDEFMKTYSSPLLACLLIGLSSPAWAQHMHGSGELGHKTLLLAQLDGEQVAGGSDSKATGTGVFQIDPVSRMFEYRLTYNGLERGSPQSIVLYNFGRGKSGEPVYVLCGSTNAPCPKGTSNTIAKKIKRNEGPKIDNNLLGEFLSERVYVEIVGGDGTPEIRGQLAPNSTMATFKNYVADLSPRGGGKGGGTAVVSETYMPDGKITVDYAATVTGLTAAPTSVALGPAKAGGGKKRFLPNVKLRFARDRNSGGSLRGQYTVDANAPDAALPSNPEPGQTAAGFVISTVQSPDGAVEGELVPVE
jgi:hypothetical protein